MKRYFFIAAMAILAVGCQKTEIQNEVQTPIGFSTEVGKQTKAIVQNGQNGKAAYLTDQPFGVYAYGHQGTATPTPVMDNVEVSYTKATTGDNPTPEKWAVSTDQTVTTKYYWPNDPNTTLNFYAYSPAQPKTGVNSKKAAHQELTGTISHSEDTGLKLTDYVHSNMYVDFMVATPVLNATYSDPNGDGANGGDAGVVPVDFGHKLTQVNFVVKIADTESYPNVDFKINSIVLNNIVSNGTYSYAYTPATTGTDGTPVEATVTEGWQSATSKATASYKIYPATKANVPATLSEGDNGYSYRAPELENVNTTNPEETEVTVILRTDYRTRTQIKENTTERDLTAAENPGKSFSTTPVTMIPQTLTKTDATPDVDQSFTISYTISGTGVATETVVKTFDFYDATATSVPTWGINKRITYVLTISLNEITFSPIVTNWTEEEGTYVDPANN